MLPPSIQQEITLARAVTDDLQRGWPPDVVLALWQQMTWYDLPYLLLPAFPSLSASDIRLFATSVRLFGNAILIHDHLVDRNTCSTDVATTTVRIMAMQFEAYRLMHSLFPPEAPFWDHLRGYLSIYTDTCLVECQFTSGTRPWCDYTDDTARRIASGKFSVSCVIVAGLVELARAPALLSPMVDALNHFNIACQLWDDLNDWKEDLRHRVPSLLLARVLPERPDMVDGDELQRESLRVGRQMYYGGHATHVLRMALDSLESALDLKKIVPELPWYGIIDILHEKYASLLRDLEQIMAHNIGRARQQRNDTFTVPPAR